MIYGLFLSFACGGMMSRFCLGSNSVCAAVISTIVFVFRCNKNRQDGYCDDFRYKKCHSDNPRPSTKRYLSRPDMFIARHSNLVDCNFSVRVHDSGVVQSWQWGHWRIFWAEICAISVLFRIGGSVYEWRCVANKIYEVLGKQRRKRHTESTCTDAT